ncbi:MAG: hypothetical protein ACYSWP_09225 [Planctomycetota bacterium]|jgi:hypothetical protein
MKNKKLYNKIRQKQLILLFLSICLELFLAQGVTADTFYLKGGSVITGTILEETHEDFLIENTRLGQLYILWDDVIYREIPQADILSESYTILDNSLDVIANLTRSVPEKRTDANSFNLLIHGIVLSVTDEEGSDIPFDQRPIGDSDLITIDYDWLGPDTNRLTIITQQPGLIRDESGIYTFRLKYILNEQSRIRVIIRYPKTLQLETINPEPAIEHNGLIVWDQNLKRQQNFKPQIQFIP